MSDVGARLLGAADRAERWADVLDQYGESGHQAEHRATAHVLRTVSEHVDHCCAGVVTAVLELADEIGVDGDD